MNAIEYQFLAMEKEANQCELHAWYNQQGVTATRLTNGIRGLTDEVGELNAAAKKWLEYKQPLDEVNIMEEVGDCLWRLAQICKAVDITLSEAMDANIRKLDRRYKDKCTPEESKEENRDREAERKTLMKEEGDRQATILEELGIPNYIIEEGKKDNFSSAKEDEEKWNREAERRAMDDGVNYEGNEE